MEEIWKDIPNYEGYYQISNLGKVKRLKRKTIRPKGFANIEEIILKSGLAKSGYLTVSLTKDKKAKTHTMHQLVAITFLNHKPCGYDSVIDHIDNDKLNNKIDNLQITTVRHNSSKDRKNTSSKYTGVCFVKRENKWSASIVINKKNVSLGQYKNEYDAHLAYQNKLKEIIV